MLCGEPTKEAHGVKHQAISVDIVQRAAICDKRRLRFKTKLEHKHSDGQTLTAVDS